MNTFLTILCVAGGIASLIAGLVCMCMNGRRKIAALLLALFLLSAGMLPTVVEGFGHGELWGWVGWLASWSDILIKYFAFGVNVALAIILITVAIPWVSWDLWGESKPTTAAASAQFQPWSTLVVVTIMAATVWYNWFLFQQAPNAILEELIEVKTENDVLNGRTAGGTVQMHAVRYALAYSLEELPEETQKALVAAVEAKIEKLAENHKLKNLTGITLSEGYSVTYLTHSTANWQDIVVFVDGKIPAVAGPPAVEEQEFTGEQFTLDYTLSVEDTNTLSTEQIEKLKEANTALGRDKNNSGAVGSGKREDSGTTNSSRSRSNLFPGANLAI